MRIFVEKMIHRSLEDIIKKNLFLGKAIIVLGPRQVGKSTLFHQINKLFESHSIFLDCDNIDIKSALSNANITQLKRILGNNDVIFIDEAQRVKNIGLTLKIIIDQIKPKQLFVSGSSSFELTNEINEPLTGRKFEYLMLPLSLKELSDYLGFLEERRNLEYRLIYGTYPDVINNFGNEVEILNNLANSYLFKDIFNIHRFKNPEIIEMLLESLALQVGSEVSYNELAQTIGSNSHTVKKYIQILERAFIIFKLRSFSKNARNEIKKSRKIYFYDNGIRNAILGNFSLINNRTDIGSLWENFVISERIKYLNNNKIYAKKYFWRTKQKQEIDYIEEFNGQLNAFEIKWNPNKKVKISKTFTSNYPDATTHIINRENIWDYVGV